MSSFVPEKEHLRHALLFLFNQKKKAAESQRLLVETYGEHAPSIRTCETWFRQFKSGDFNVKDSERSGRSQKFEDEQLQELLDDDPTQTQRQLAEALQVSQETISRRLRVMGKIHKLGMGQKTWQSDFVTRQCAVSHSKTSERHLEIAWMGHPSAPAVFARPGAI